MSAIALPKIRIDGIEYFIDVRLSEIREVNNPHNAQRESRELLNFWVAHGITELN